MEVGEGKEGVRGGTGFCILLGCAVHAVEVGEVFADAELGVEIGCCCGGTC